MYESYDGEADMSSSGPKYAALNNTHDERLRNTTLSRVFRNTVSVSSYRRMRLNYPAFLLIPFQRVTRFVLGSVTVNAESTRSGRLRVSNNVRTAAIHRLLSSLKSRISPRRARLLS